MVLGAKLMFGLGSSWCVDGLEEAALVEGVLVIGVSSSGVLTRSKMPSGESLFTVISLILLFIEGLG